MTDTFILNNEPTERKILNGYTDFFGNKVKGKFVKVGTAYCNIKDLENNNLDKWLKEKLK